MLSINLGYINANSAIFETAHFFIQIRPLPSRNQRVRSPKQHCSETSLHSPLHISHDTACLPSKILHNPCFPFLLGYYSRPKGNWKQCLCKIWGGQIRCIMGDVQVVNSGSRSTSPRIQIKNMRFEKYPDSCGQSFIMSVKKVFQKKLSQNPLSIEDSTTERESSTDTKVKLID